MEILEFLGYFPSKSVEIIEIYSISDFGTLFFVFFTFQRGFVRENGTLRPIIQHEVRARRKNVTLVSNIRSMFSGRTFLKSSSPLVSGTGGGTGPPPQLENLSWTSSESVYVANIIQGHSEVHIDFDYTFYLNQKYVFSFELARFQSEVIGL